MRGCCLVDGAIIAKLTGINLQSVSRYSSLITSFSAGNYSYLAREILPRELFGLYPSEACASSLRARHSVFLREDHPRVCRGIRIQDIVAATFPRNYGRKGHGEGSWRVSGRIKKLSPGTKTGEADRPLGNENWQWNESGSGPPRNFPRPPVEDRAPLL